MYMTALDDPSRVIAEPAGFLMVPEGEEYVGDVMNVLFSNGWIADEDGKVFIYYASCDTRMHMATRPWTDWWIIVCIQSRTASGQESLWRDLRH